MVREGWPRVNPLVVAAKSGAVWEGDRLRLSFFNLPLRVHHPSAEVDGEIPEWLQLVIFHYLLTADGTAVADEWIALRQLPGAYFHEAGFHSQTLEPLAQGLGRDVAGFHHSALSLGGTTITRTGDAAYRFLAFPHLPLACILYLADEEMPASVSILFDRSASHYLPTEDLVVVTKFLAGALLGQPLPAHLSMA